MQSITRDNGTQYSLNQPEWVDSNENGTIDGGPTPSLDGTIDGTAEHTWPISFMRTTALNPGDSGMSYMAATPTFGFLGTETGVWEVEGTTSVTGLQGSAMIFGPSILSQVGQTLTSFATANQPLPDTVEAESLVIHWQISFDGGKTWQSLAIGTSKNFLFVTGGSAPAAFETVLWLGCSGAAGVRPKGIGDSKAAGLEDDREVVDGVWSSFEGNVTRRVDGTIMKYNHIPTVMTTAAQMLSNPAASGECDAWADLLVLALHAEGETSAQSIRILPRTGYYKFIVMALPAQGSQGASLTVPSETQFVFHQLVVVPGVYNYKIYDPSYGYCDALFTGAPTPAQLEQAYENHSVVDDLKTPGATPTVHNSRTGPLVWPRLW